MDGNKNIRKFMDNLAYSKNLDPLVPETWYSIPLRELRFQQKGKVFNSIFTSTRCSFYGCKFVLQICLYSTNPEIGVAVVSLLVI